ncbi:HDOD domain-containing protein [bacterium AH-315-M10]|nr:HDOD domain-containing protein [bacterium AH-315-M10]
MKQKETLRLVVVSLSKRLGNVIQQGLSRFQVQLTNFTRVDKSLGHMLRNPPHVVLIEDQLRSAYNCAAAIRQRLPQTGVILISRSMTRNKVLLAAQAGVTHIVVRPFALTTLLSRISSACNSAGNDGGNLVPTAEEVIDLLREAPDGQAVLDQLKRIETLQAVPHVVQRVLAITGDDSSGASEMERVVQGDPNITAIVLKRANSTYYSGVKKITRVRDAITRIGFNNVRNIVLALSVMKMNDRESNQVGFDREEFWKASLATAIVSREFANHLGLPRKEEAFVIGLLADFGGMVLDEHMPEKLEQSICLAHQELLSLGEAQKRVLGITHAQVGAFVLNRWGFPETMINILGGQQAAEAASPLSAPDKMLRTAIWMARWTVAGLGIGDKSEVILDHAPKEMTMGFNIAGLINDDFIQRLLDEVNEMLAFFKVEVKWPGKLEPGAPSIYIYESVQPTISPLELIVRRLGAQPVRVRELDELDNLDFGTTAIVSLSDCEELKHATKSRDWEDLPWMFVLPRGRAPHDDSLKQSLGLPVGDCRYAEHPLMIADVVTTLAGLEANRK